MQNENNDLAFIPSQDVEPVETPQEPVKTEETPKKEYWDSYQEFLVNLA